MACFDRLATTAVCATLYLGFASVFGVVLAIVALLALRLLFAIDLLEIAPFDLLALPFVVTTLFLLIPLARKDLRDAWSPPPGATTRNGRNADRAQEGGQEGRPLNRTEAQTWSG